MSQVRDHCIAFCGKQLLYIHAVLRFGYFFIPVYLSSTFLGISTGFKSVRILKVIRKGK